MDRYHLELGVVMAARWDLPPVISDAISLHHSQERTAASDPAIVEVVVEVYQVIDLLATHTRLGVKELLEVKSLTQREREVLVKAIEALPGLRGLLRERRGLEEHRDPEPGGSQAAAARRAFPVLPARWC